MTLFKASKKRNILAALTLAAAVVTTSFAGVASAAEAEDGSDAPRAKVGVVSSFEMIHKHHPAMVKYIQDVTALGEEIAAKIASGDFSSDEKKAYAKKAHELTDQKTTIYDNAKEDLRASVQELAKAQGYDIVFDDLSVAYGGTNLDQQIDLTKKVDSAVSTEAKSNMGVVFYEMLVFDDQRMFSFMQEFMKADREFKANAAGMSNEEREKGFREMERSMNQKRQETLVKIQPDVVKKIQEVADKRGLSVVFDEPAVVYGPLDITQDFYPDLKPGISSSGMLNLKVGYADQKRFEEVPKMKALYEERNQKAKELKALQESDPTITEKELAKRGEAIQKAFMDGKHQLENEVFGAIAKEQDLDIILFNRPGKPSVVIGGVDVTDAAIAKAQ